MKPITIADMLALPKMYEIPRDIADEVVSRTAPARSP